MIYVTGDTHADYDISKLNTGRFPQQKGLTKSDYVIICGDFGLVWDGSRREAYWQKWLSNKNFTTLFVDGNHENFDALRMIPHEEKFGGQVRQIAPDIYHLDRGQVLTIDGQKIFTMGGARSVDKHLRIEHLSWWEEELPSKEEMDRAIEALDAVDWKVDYVISHCAPKSVQHRINPYYENDTLTSFFERVQQDLQFKRWYFGHYHTDKIIDEKFVALYQNVMPVL